VDCQGARAGRDEVRPPDQGRNFPSCSLLRRDGKEEQCGDEDKAEEE
jgi:hypothetical protein